MKDKMGHSFLLSILFLEGIGCVHITYFHVPDQAIRGDNLTLVCEFDLGQNKLYSVTWTKGTHDFYTFKYLPSGQPTKGVFHLPGINVDEKSSTDSTVVLKNLQVSATGLIECAVTAEHTFVTDSRKQYLAVLDIPSEPPILHSYYSSQNYRMGEKISLKCDTPPSFPAANITWFINSQKVAPQLVTHDPIRKLHRGPDTLERSSSLLKFVVQEKHFENGKITIICEATIKNRYKETAEYLAYKEGFIQRMFSSSARIPSLEWLLLLHLYTFYVFMQPLL
ncbi:uncharacterized protein LOC136026942 isoform X2 [Artemia franciscana]|uniref:Ig-like domain-containing protein n=1 Tax=Artemia franciscana TaxID=6661 RepID=A0AA88HCM2_ARTSF|nr:hypothetical protein QYM36_013281 [Artemia franciscana]